MFACVLGIMWVYLGAYILIYRCFDYYCLMGAMVWVVCLRFLLGLFLLVLL